MKKSFLILECFLSIFLVSLFISCKTDVNIPEKKVELVKLIPSKTELTKDPYDVNVDISKFQNMKAIKWAEGKKDTQYFIDGGGEEISTEKKFLVAKNGEYTVFVTDGEKNNVISIISIDNIDMTPPKSVQNLVGEYNKEAKTITLSWDNPTDSDYKELKILKNGESTSLTKDKNTYSFKNIVYDKTIYNFEVSTLDNLGNESAPVTVSVRAGVNINAIKLDRNNILYNDPYLKIKVELEIKNEDCIDGDKIYVKIFDMDNNKKGSDGYFSINKGYATIEAPELKLREAPQNYKVKVFIDDIEYPLPDTGFSISIGPSKPSNKRINTSGAHTIDINTVTDSTFVDFTFNADNLDLVNKVTVAFWDQNHNIVGDYIEVPKKYKEDTKYTVKMPVPKQEGLFTPKVFYDGVNQNPYKPEYFGYSLSPTGEQIFIGDPKLIVYGEPEFNKLYIPKLGIKNDTNIDSFFIEITGKNFTSNEGLMVKIDNTDIATEYYESILFLSATKIKIPLPLPHTECNQNIEVLYKDKKVLEGTITVRDYSSYNIGDKITQGDKTIGIVAGKNKYGAPFIIGTDINQKLILANEGTIGEKYYIEDNLCHLVEKYDGEYEKDMFGKDNWNNIRSLDPEGTRDAKNNYPAFYWADNYGNEKKMEGKYKTGWYIPSINELHIIHKNFEAVKTAFYGLQMYDFVNLSVISSSQYEYDESRYGEPNNDLSKFNWKYALNGLCNKIDKKTANDVICIHELEL